MDADSLFLVFDFLNVVDKVSFSLVCKSFRYIFSKWTDHCLFIVYHQGFITLDELIKFGETCKKYNQLTRHALENNNSIRIRYIKTHHVICQNENSFLISDKTMPNFIHSGNFLCDFGVAINYALDGNQNRCICVSSLWNQMILIPIHGVTFPCFTYFHHHFQNNRLLFHISDDDGNDHSYFLDFSTPSTPILSQLKNENCCPWKFYDQFYDHHFYAYDNQSLICSKWTRRTPFPHIQPNSLVLNAKGIKWNQGRLNRSDLLVSFHRDNYDWATYSGPFIILFKDDKIIRINNLLNDGTSLTPLNPTEQNVDMVSRDQLQLIKWYPNKSIIHIFFIGCCLILKLNQIEKTFSLTYQHGTDLEKNIYILNEKTTKMESISIKKVGKNFNYRSIFDNSLIHFAIR